MIRHNKTLLIIIIAVLAGTVLIYFYLTAEKNKFEWHESYDSKSKEPYGTSYIKTLLKSFYKSATFIENTDKPMHALLQGRGRNTVLISIGHNLFLEESDIEALSQFVKRGGQVLIASNLVPQELMSSLYASSCQEEINYLTSDLRTARLNFFHPQLRQDSSYTFSYRYESEDMNYEWMFLNPEIFCLEEESITALGYLGSSDAVNFYKLHVGNNGYYFHTNPIIFTNYFISKKENIGYISGVFSHLQGTTIIWDDYSKLPLINNNASDKGPLYYLLSQPSLKYAWWLFLGTVVLYIVFAAKRTQREIPVYDKKSNTSLEYVQMIAALHFENANHLDMARKKMKHFFYFIRTKYGIQGHAINEVTLTRLAEKSKVSKGHLKELFDLYHLIDKYSYTNIESDKLSKLFFSIDYFYKNCK